MSNKFFDDSQDYQSEESQDEFASYSEEQLQQNEESEEQAESYEEHEQTDEEYEMEESQILSDARLRLEQGRLYEMLMKHSLFGSDVNADPRAVKNVEREIRSFVKDRLEVMLGIKSEKPKNSVGLSEEEVYIVKSLVARAKGGAGIVQSEPKPIRVEEKGRPVNKGLNTLGNGKTAPAPKPVARPSVQQKVKKMALPESKPLEKPIYEMTGDELKRRNDETVRRQRALQAQNQQAIPMPPPGAEEGIYQASQAKHRVALEGAPMNGSFIFDVLSKAGRLSD